MLLVHRMCTKSIGFWEWARNCGDQADFEVEGMNHKKMVTKHFDLPNCLKHLYISQRTKQLKNSKVRLTLLLGGLWGHAHVHKCPCIKWEIWLGHWLWWLASALGFGIGFAYNVDNCKSRSTTGLSFHFFSFAESLPQPCFLEGLVLSQPWYCVRTTDVWNHIFCRIWSLWKDRDQQAEYKRLDRFCHNRCFLQHRHCCSIQGKRCGKWKDVGRTRSWWPGRKHY